MDYQIYHNPRCSKSRAALALLNEAGVKVKIIEYLKTPPDLATLKGIADKLGGTDKLGVRVRQMMRVNEGIYEQLRLADESDDAKLFAALAAHSVLLQRPVIVYGAHAVIARPPELIHALL